jgi:hypothetical protein
MSHISVPTNPPPPPTLSQSGKVDINTHLSQFGGPNDATVSNEVAIVNLIGVDLKHSGGIEFNFS